MSTWEERLIDERDELRAKHKKLFDFINKDGGEFESLDEEDQKLLYAQVYYMHGYLTTLNKRISRIKS